MIKLTRPKIVLVISLGILVVGLLTVLSPKEIKWEITRRPPPYIPGKPSELPPVNPEDLLSSPEVNPFISVKEKHEIQTELELPPAISKPIQVNLLSPLPDSHYLKPLEIPLPVKGTKTASGSDQTPNIPLPNPTDLPSLADLKQFIDEISQMVTPPPPAKKPEVFDTITLNDNTVLEGKIINEDETTITFQKKGKDHFTPYYKKDIKNIERAYLPEELYEIKSKEIPAGNAEKHYQLAKWCLTQNLESQALEQALQAIETDQPKLDYYLLATDLYHKRMALEKEISLYQKALGTSIVNKEIIHLRLGEIYEMLGLVDEALKSYELAVKVYPRYSDGWVKLAETYLKRGDDEKARKYYKQAQEITPDNPRASYGISLIDFRQGKFTLARTGLLKTVDNLNQNQSLRAEAETVLGVISVLSETDRNYHKAAQYFQSAIRSNPYQAAPWTNLAFLYLITPGTMSREAIELLVREAINFDPTSSLPWLIQGYLNWLLEGPDKALAEFQTGLKIEPQHFMTCYALAQVYFTRQEMAQAKEMFETCLKITPTFLEPLFYLTLIAFKQGNFTEAHRYLELYLRLKERSGDKLNLVDYANAGLIYLGIKDWKTAESFLKQALSINPRFAPALNGLGFLLYATKQPDQAIARFNEALRSSKDDPYALKSLEAIQLAARQEVWQDDFKRPNSETIGKGWLETEPYGIEIEIANQQLRFSGTQRLRDQGLTFMERVIEREPFLRFEACLDIKRINNAVVGIYLAQKSADAKGILLFGIVPLKEPPGYKLAYQISETLEVIPTTWNYLNIDLPPPRPNVQAELKLSLTQVPFPPNSPTEIKLFLDKTPVATIPFTKLRFLMAGPEWTAGIFGASNKEQTWELLIKQVKLFELRRRE